MNNTELHNELRHLKNRYGATIEKFIWLANVDKLNIEFVDTLKKNFLYYAFDEEIEFGEENNYDTLKKHNKFGFLAEVAMPQMENIVFKDEVIYCWDEVPGQFYYFFVYGETVEELVHNLKQEIICAIQEMYVNQN